MVADQNNAPERLKDLIYRVLRNYRQSEVADEEGDGYPLVDALTITGHSIDMGEREIANIADTLAYEIARADRAAPEGQGYFGPMGIPHWSSALTPPPPAPTDNTALVEALRELTKQGRKTWNLGAQLGPHWVHLGAAVSKAERLLGDLASREAPPDSDSGEKPLCPVCYNRTDAELRTIGGFYSMESNCPECSPRAKERAKQDADREALVRLLQIITRNGSLDDGRTLHEVIADALLARGLRPPACQQEAVTESDLAAALAEIERLTSVVCGLTERCDDAREAAEKAIAERDAALALLADAYGAGTGGSVIESLLADAERDMRQRAAELVRQEVHRFPVTVARGVEDVAKAILALPLKHADREGGV